MKLKVLNLSVCVRNRTLIHCLSFELGLGESLSIIGPSGSGKTTLLKGILGIGEFLVTGKIYSNDQLIQHDRQALVAAHMRRFGYVPQELALWPHLSVSETLKLAQRFSQNHLASKNKGDSIDFLEKLILGCGLKNLLHKLPRSLSGGEKQRLAIARALVIKPQLLALDEPFSGLDAVAKAQLISLIKEQTKQENLSLIFISHDLAESLAMAKKNHDYR